jgi:hypothetical protein
MTDQELMQSIKTKWGAVIATACQASSVPESFLAALIAGESGGNPDAKRFEKNVLASLWQVLLGRAPHYGSISRPQLFAYISAVRTGQTPRPADSLPGDAFERLDELATSWGLTQIMGYHLFDVTPVPGGVIRTIEQLKEPAETLRLSIFMLATFAHQFSLSLVQDFGELFTCWNTGSPHGTTFDPNYVRNGVTRMGIYETLP